MAYGMRDTVHFWLKGFADPNARGTDFHMCVVTSLKEADIPGVNNVVVPDVDEQEDNENDESDSEHNEDNATSMHMPEELEDWLAIGLLVVIFWLLVVILVIKKNYTFFKNRSSVRSVFEINIC